MRVVVTTWNKYRWLMPTFLHFYDRNWPNNPYLTSFTSGAAPWLDGVIDHLESIEDDQVLLLMDDYILNAPVNTGMVAQAVNMCAGDVGCVQLSAREDACHPYFFDCGIEGFKEYPLDKPYSVTLQAGVWQREFLLRIMQRGETAWDVELKGSTRVSEYGKRVLSTTTPAMYYHPSGYMQKGKVVESVKQWTKENW